METQPSTKAEICSERYLSSRRLVSSPPSLHLGLKISNTSISVTFSSIYRLVHLINLLKVSCEFSELGRKLEMSSYTSRRLSRVSLRNISYVDGHRDQHGYCICLPAYAPALIRACFQTSQKCQEGVGSGGKSR